MKLDFETGRLTGPRKVSVKHSVEIVNRASQNFYSF